MRCSAKSRTGGLTLRFRNVWRAEEQGPLRIMTRHRIDRVAYPVPPLPGLAAPMRAGGKPAVMTGPILYRNAFRSDRFGAFSGGAAYRPGAGGGQALAFPAICGANAC